METFNFKGIGTEWWIKIFDETKDAQALNASILSIVKEFEANFSRFIPESFVSKLNANKSLENFPEELFDILIKAEEISKLTDGYFTVFAGRILENLGYDKDYSFKAENVSNIEQDRFIELSKKKIQISENSRIDLGGIGKGWLIDKLANFLKSQSIKYFSINGGGDIYATSDREKPIEFALENPFDVSEMIGTISIKTKGIASSSGNRRNWVDTKLQKKFHHLIDVKKGESANNNIAAVYTLGNNALDADIASTSIFVSSNEIWTKISEGLNVEYLVVFDDGKYLKSKQYLGKLNN